MKDKLDDLKIGLALSGGGVRASAFHMGVLARLGEEDLLKKVNMTSTVSGGSLLLGLVYTANNNRWPNKEQLEKVVYPFVRNKHIKKNLQVRVIVSQFSRFWISMKNGKAKHVSLALKNVWGIKSQLNDIEAYPRWNICATTYQSGKSWRFIPNNRMGDYILNYVEKPDISLSDALCCSAGVPYLLGTLKLKTNRFSWYKYDENGNKVSCIQNTKKIHLWDGGVHDNLGIEPLVKFDNGCKYRPEFDYLIVSDASAPLDPTKRKGFSFKRLLDITTDQVRAIRSRVLYDHFEQSGTGTYLRIGDNEEQHTLTKAEIKFCEDYGTTLMKMKKEDFDLLIKHGWEVANSSLLKMNSNFFKDIPFRKSYNKNK